MNFKKFKKSLVSIVLGSSLFLGNGGVICQQPRAWLTDEFFTTARERYKDDQNIQLLLMVSKFLSDLRRPSALNTEPVRSWNKLLEDIYRLQLSKPHIPCLIHILRYLRRLSEFPTRTAALNSLSEVLTEVSRPCVPEQILQSEAPDRFETDQTTILIQIVATLLEFSILTIDPDDEQEALALKSLPALCQTIAPLRPSKDPTWMMGVLSALLKNAERNLK